MAVMSVVTITGMLTKAQGRRFDDDDMMLWEDLLEGLDPSLAEAATMDLLRTSTEFITPALIRQHTHRLGKARLEAAGAPPTPPSGLSAEQYIAWLKGWRRSITHGGSRDAAAAAALDSTGVKAIDPGSPDGKNVSYRVGAVNVITQRSLDTDTN